MKKNNPFLEYQEQVKSALTQLEAYVLGEGDEWLSSELEGIFNGADKDGGPLESTVRYWIYSKLSDSKAVEFEELVQSFVFYFDRLYKFERWIRGLRKKQRFSDRAKNINLRNIESLTNSLKDLKKYLEVVSQEVEEREKVAHAMLGILSTFGSDPQNLKASLNPKPKRGRRPKADLKNRNNQELLIAILLKHHRYGSKDDLKTDPISTKEACKLLGKTEPTLSRTWREVKPGLTYAGYVKLCGHYDSLRKFLKAIDSKEGYLEKSNKEGAIDNAED